MYNFILQILIMVSLGVIIYLMARAVPRVGDDISKSSAKSDIRLNSPWLEKLDVVLSNFLEKFLRKVKLILMKLDNATNDYLNKIKKAKLNGNGQKNEEKPTLFSTNGEEEKEEEKKEEQEEKED